MLGLMRGVSARGRGGVIAVETRTFLGGARRGKRLPENIDELPGTGGRGRFVRNARRRGGRGGRDMKLGSTRGGNGWELLHVSEGAILGGVDRVERRQQRTVSISSMVIPDHPFVAFTEASSNRC